MSNIAFSVGVKVGFTLKDTSLRAQELSHTGVPAAWVVEYEAYLPNPREIEQQIHKKLLPQKYNKEFFECTPEEAIAAIKEVSGSIIETENYLRANREDAIKILDRNILKNKKEQTKKDLQRQYSALLEKNIELINERYNSKIDSLLPNRNRLTYWFFCFVVTWVVIMIITNAEKAFVGKSIIAGLIGGIASVILIERQRKKDRQSTEVQSLQKKKEEEIDKEKENTKSIESKVYLN